MLKLLTLFLTLALGNAYALEIDAKLTLRIIKSSESKKTILINRGQEDGLTKADHAKFFLSTGVIARGVCVKVSPSRSVWSLYRLVNAGYVKNDQVMQLKITKEVKITNDESKSIVLDDTTATIDTDPRALGIPLAKGADDIVTQEKLSAADQAMFNSAMGSTPIQLSQKNKELFLTFHYSNQTTSVTNESSDSYKGADSYMDLDLGFEYYLPDDNTWYSRMSPFAGIKMLRSQLVSFEGTSISESAFLFGGGVNIYPFKKPYKSDTLIGFLTGSFYFGSSDNKISPGSAGTTSFKEENIKSSVVYYTLGGGYKYYTAKGYGASLSLSYVSRGDTFAEDSGKRSWVKNGTGPKIFAAFRYRF